MRCGTGWIRRLKPDTPRHAGDRVDAAFECRQRLGRLHTAVVVLDPLAPAAGPDFGDHRGQGSRVLDAAGLAGDVAVGEVEVPTGGELRYQAVDSGPRHAAGRDSRVCHETPA